MRLRVLLKKNSNSKNLNWIEIYDLHVYFSNCNFQKTHMISWFLSGNRLGPFLWTTFHMMLKKYS